MDAPICGGGIEMPEHLMEDKRILAFLFLKECERCGCSLQSRGMSWFTLQTICGDCLRKEKAIRTRMREQGQDPNQYEGCGYVPEIEGADEQSGGGETGKKDKAGGCRPGRKETKDNPAKGISRTTEKVDERHHVDGGANH